MTARSPRTSPEVFKPAIDAALVRIARVAAADADAVQRALAGLREGRAFPYLLGALHALRGLVDVDRLRAAGAGTWLLYFLEGKDARYEGHFLEPEGAGFEDELGQASPIRLEFYPEQAHAALRHQDFVGGQDADVVGLWRLPDGREAIYHAHPEGFSLLGDDAIDFVEREAARLEPHPR